MRSLRGRLVLGLLGGITLFLALTGLAVHQVVEARLHEGLDATLEAVLRSSVDDVVREQGRRKPAESRRRPPRGKSFLGWLLPEQEDVLLQAWAEDGTTLFRSDALEGQDLPRLARDLEVHPLKELGEAEPLRTQIPLPGSGAPARAMAFRSVTRERPFREESRVIELVVAHDSTGLDETLAELRWLLVLGWLVSSAGCAGIVSWIVHVGLRPLGRLRDQMGRHGAGDLQRPFVLPDAPQELAPVVDQLNDLMGRIGGAFEREQAFASDAAHELRTPLAGLRATLELALSRPRESEALRAAAEQSLAITREMEALVATLLELGRASARSRRPAQVVDVADLLTASWSAHAAEAQARGLSLELDVPADARLASDPVLLARVLDNLVENAAAHAAKGSALEVRAAPCGTSGEPGWRLSFSNRVLDADPRLAERALAAFWRADGSRGETGRHAGLGLPLCLRIVESLGGRLETELVGDRFSVHVSLPAR